MQLAMLSSSRLNLPHRKGIPPCFLLPVMVSILLLGSLCNYGSAAEPYTEISAPLLKHLMETDPNVLVVNVLSTIEYEMHHITGSINIPINVIKDSVKLPADKSTPLVFYCMGTR